MSVDLPVRKANPAPWDRRDPRVNRVHRDLPVPRVSKVLRDLPLRKVKRLNRDHPAQNRIAMTTV